MQFADLQAGKPVTGVFAGSEKSFLATKVNGTNWLLVVALDSADSTAGLRAQLKASAVSLIVLVILAGALMHWIVATMLRRLITIRDAMNAISSGTDDLSQRLPEQGNDEVAQIAHAFNAFSDKLSVVMVKLRDSSHSVQQAAQEIAAGNQDLSERTEQAVCARPPVRLSRLPLLLLCRRIPPHRPTIRHIPPLRLRHAGVKWYRRPFQPCNLSKWLRPKLEILPA